MKRTIVFAAVLFAAIFPAFAMASQAWRETDASRAPKEVQLIKPDAYRVYTLDELALRSQLQNLSADPQYAQIISLPMPDGSMRDFRVWADPMMPQDLAAQFPEITTYSAEAVDDARVGGKLDLTLYGFHSMIFDGAEVAFIDPYDNFRDGYYLAYYKKDLSRAEKDRMNCGIHEDDPGGEASFLSQSGLPGLAAKTLNGYSLRTYRLALSCSSQYAIAATGVSTPTVAQVLSKMTTTMNRVNGVFQRELSITMVFVANENALINTSSSGDPFFSINSNSNSCLSQNKTTCNSVIGAANYDIGHVFTTGSGGLATLGCVCTNNKAQGTTGNPSPTGDGFDIDYVAHEMGHQYGANHTFNNSTDGSCAGGNRASSTAYEPGSGSTIMAYAGICAPDNVQGHSDAYFHRASLDQIITYVNGGGNCSANTATGNKYVGYTPMSTTSWSIPYLTPFELTAPAAIDSAADSVVLYCWEENDKTSSGATWSATTSAGPIFRSIAPTTSNVRVFPKISSVLAGNLSSAYEKAPTVARTLTFKLTYRNIRNNKGCITIPDETVTLNAVTTGTGAGFKVTSQDIAGIEYAGASTQTVTWDVLNTASAPINTANVDIWMSNNGGTAYQYFVGTFPNTGSASITVPNPSATIAAARFKVKGTNNVFFNVNKVNFRVTNNPSAPVSPTGVSAIPVSAVTKIFPVPATDVLHIEAAQPGTMEVYNALGQQFWQGKTTDAVSINVAQWPRGVYFLRLTGAAGNVLETHQVILR
ncbi:MAG: T9SS type A sorting domain-containing protein [Taibaiella sp.]|nr:T9SS type A sorting domain-containing protein [Taibaiella sp.]